MRSPLHPDTMLDIHLSTICSRNKYTHDPAPVIAELEAAAGSRSDILAQVAGRWAGYYDSPETRPLADALRQIPGTAPWVIEGRRRRAIAVHGAPMNRS